MESKNEKTMTKMLRKAKGVTMLALVVTIIVLLILAAITLNLAVGENGIIERAKSARDKAKNASIAEEEAMNEAAGEIDNAGNSSGGGNCPECPDTKPLEDRIKELESQVGVLQQQLEEERANKQELENRITELNNQIAELNKQIEAGNTEKAKLQEEITKLQNQLTASQTENEKLRAQITELNKQVTNLNTQLGEKNKTIETQKQQIANLQGQITEKDKVISQKNETIKTMQSTIDGLNTQIANLNKQIETLKAKQATGNAAVSDVLAGKTFSNSSGVGLVGTMANNGAINATLNAGQSYNVPTGYTAGGRITAESLANQTPGTASANNLSNGVTAWVNGIRITGNGADENTSYERGYTAGYNAAVQTRRVSFTLSHSATSDLRDSSPNTLKSDGKLKIDVTNFTKLYVGGAVSVNGQTYEAGEHDISSLTGNIELCLTSSVWDDRAGHFATSGSVSGYFE